MNNKTNTRKAAVAGLVGLAAGIAATTVLVSELAADTPDSTAVERHESAPSAQHYTGPRTADAAEHWLRPRASYTGPTTPDSAECWFKTGSKYTGPTTPDAAEHWLAYC